MERQASDRAEHRSSKTGYRESDRRRAELAGAASEIDAEVPKGHASDDSRDEARPDRA